MQHVTDFCCRWVISAHDTTEIEYVNIALTCEYCWQAVCNKKTGLKIKKELNCLLHCNNVFHVSYYKKRSLYRLNIYHIVSYRHIYHIGILSFCSYWFAALHNFFSMHLETDYLVNCCYCCCASLYTKNKSRQVYIN